MTKLLLILLLLGNFAFAEDKFPTINIKASKKQLNNMTTADKLTLYNMEKKSLIVAAVKIDYVNQLEHPSNIIIGQKVSRIGTKSYDIESAVFKEDNNLLICKSTITSVCYDFINNKTIPIYQEIIDDYHKK